MRTIRSISIWLVGWALCVLLPVAHGNDTVSGTVYQSDRTTTLPDGLTIAIVLNGSETATTELASGDGSFSTDAGGSFADNTPFALYIKGDATSDGQVFSVASGSGDISGIAIYIDHVIVTSHDNRDVTNADIETPLAVIPSGDKLCSVDGSDNLTVSSGKHLDVQHGTTHDYTPGHSVTVGGELRLATGSAFSTGIHNLTVSGNTTLEGALSSSTGTVDLGGTVTLNAGGSLSVTGGALEFAGDVTDTGSGSTDLEDAAVTIDGNVRIVSNEYLYFSSLTVASGYTLTVDGYGSGDKTTVNGTSVLSGAAVTLEDGELYFTGTITNDADTVITLDTTPGGEIIQFGAALSLAGSIVTDTDGGVLDFNGDLSATGNLDLGAGTTLNFAGDLDLTNATLGSGSGVTSLGGLTASPAVVFDGTTELTPHSNTTWPDTQVQGTLTQANSAPDMELASGKGLTVSDGGQFTVTRGLTVPGTVSILGSVTLGGGTIILATVNVGQ